jgi:hypothetical protein
MIDYNEIEMQYDDDYQDDNYCLIILLFILLGILITIGSLFIFNIF